MWRQALISAIRELLFVPFSSCPLCGRDGHPRRLCFSCLREWSELGEGMDICRLCGRFGKNFGEAGVCQECSAEGQPYAFARSVAPYEGSVRYALHAFKFGGRRELAYPLGEVMAALVADLYPYKEFAAVVPVPLHPARAQERRFDQAELLAGVISRCLGVPLAACALRRIRETPSQTTLKRESRLTNLRGAFAAGEDAPRLEGKSVLLVDDVYTTGATVRECCDTLKGAGIESVYVVTLAAAVVRDVV
ncbi:MAG: ComF family protein [Thermacetogeniaceae bacterium]